jgi:hypothetical protein
MCGFTCASHTKKVLVLYVSVFTCKAHIWCCFVTKITLEKTQEVIGNGQYMNTKDVLAMHERVDWDLVQVPRAICTELHSAFQGDR